MTAGGGFEREGVSIIHGDALEVLPSLRGVALVLADPPYGIQYQSRKRLESFPEIAGDDAPFTAWMPCLPDVLIDGGRVVVFYRWDVQAAFLGGLKAAGLRAMSQGAWVKRNHGMGDLQAAFGAQHELLLYATKGRFVFPHGRPASVFEVPQVHNGFFVHPTEKPVALYRRLIRVLSSPGELIVDPFLGSGASAEAAWREGRRFIGVECEEQYVAAAVRRLEVAMSAPALWGVW